jgi:sugar/nucleoside kinase (ribokinase family)
VFGAALLAQLLQGMAIEPAVRAANGFAQRNVTGSGATNLQYHLRGKIAST